MSDLREIANQIEADGTIDTVGRVGVFLLPEEWRLVVDFLRRGTDRPILLGMNNPDAKTYSDRALLPDRRGSAGHRLWLLSKMARKPYLAAFERRNLLPNGDWDPDRARVHADAFAKVNRGRSVVVLGAQVWKALALRKVAPGRSLAVRWPGNTYYFLPHPSGRNLFYNREENRQIAGRLLRRLARA